MPTISWHKKPHYQDAPVHADGKSCRHHDRYLNSAFHRFCFRKAYLLQETLRFHADDLKWDLKRPFQVIHHLPLAILLEAHSQCTVSHFIQNESIFCSGEDDAIRFVRGWVPLRRSVFLFSREFKYFWVYSAFTKAAKLRITSTLTVLSDRGCCGESNP